MRKENLDSKETEDGTGTWVPVEEFIQIYWKTNISNAASKKIYLDFTNRYINTSADLSLFLTDLCTYSNEYKVLFGENNFSLFSADGSDQIKQYTNILVKTLKIKQAHPLLLQLIHVFKLKLIKEKLLKKTVKFLADFHLLYNGILTEPTNRLTSIYGPTSRTIRTILSDNDLELSDKANKIAKELQKMIVALQKLLPRTSEFENRIEGLSDLTYTNKIDTKNQKNNNERTKYILYSYTVEINNGRSISEMNIEHMLPDSPDDLNSISLGNLVFLEKKDNERIQNKPLADKLSTYQTSKNNNFSELFETGFFKSLDQSNPEAIINKRQNKILKTVYTRISAKERNIE